jgi:hypothetical protein
MKVPTFTLLLLSFLLCVCAAQHNHVDQQEVRFLYNFSLMLLHLIYR